MFGIRAKLMFMGCEFAQTAMDRCQPALAPAAA
jgi:hypothetical protein